MTDEERIASLTAENDSLRREHGSLVEAARPNLQLERDNARLRAENAMLRARWNTTASWWTRLWVAIVERLSRRKRLGELIAKHDAPYLAEVDERQARIHAGTWTDEDE